MGKQIMDIQTLKVVNMSEVIDVNSPALQELCEHLDVSYGDAEYTLVKPVDIIDALETMKEMYESGFEDTIQAVPTLEGMIEQLTLLSTQKDLWVNLEA